MGRDDVLPPQIHMKGEEEKQKKKKKKKKKQQLLPSCEFCHLRFPDLQGHMQFVHALHTCETCGKLFDSDADLQCHRNSKHPEEEEEAKAKGEDASRLVLDVGTRGDMSHPDCRDGLLQEREEEKLPSCKFCHLRCPDLQGHMQLVHYTCEICGVSFRSDAQLQSHRKSKHPDLKKKKMMMKKKKKKKKKKKQKKKKTNEEEEEEAKAKVEGEHASSFPIEKTMNKAPSPSPSISGESFPIEKTLDKAPSPSPSPPPSPSISGESEETVNQRNPKSVFVMVMSFNAQYPGALYEIELEKVEKLEKHEYKDSVGGNGVDPFTLPLLDPVLEFFNEWWKIPKLCIFHGARISSRVYILVNEIRWPYRPPFKPTGAFFIDTNDLDSQKKKKDLDSDVQQISPPKTSKTWSAVISAYGMLYYIAEPTCFPYIDEHSFERYDPTNDSWESLPPYPDYYLDQFQTQISGHAVLYGYILISMIGDEGCQMVAFHIGTETWHKVKLSKSMEALHDGFWERAVVIDNVIYALSSSLSEILAFSFWWDSKDNGEITSRRHYIGPRVSLYVKARAYPPSRLHGVRTQNLVHMGRRDFCLLQTGLNRDSLEHQYICVTTFRIVGEGQNMYIKTLRSSVFRVAIDSRGKFDIDFSFTPDCSEVEPEEEEYCVTAFAKSESTCASEDEDFFSFRTGTVKLGLKWN